MQNSQRTMITGASGFVGAELLKAFAAAGHDVIGVGRKSSGDIGDSWVVVDDINSETDWGRALSGVDLVVHSAARVHAMAKTSSDALTEFRSVNVEGTLNLARQAAAGGVRRFIFISSIKVNGEQTDDRPAFKPEDPPAPEDPYGISKYEAEMVLSQIAAETGMEVVIVRPPLVYGSGVKGNFRSLLKLADLPVPLPLGAINNQRSLVYLGNLADFVIQVSQHPAAANQTFLVSDGRDLSTTELLKSMRNALGRPAWLIPIPGWWVLKVVGFMGKAAIGQRLCGSLQLDVSQNEPLLGWTPPYTFEQGLAETVARFQNLEK